METAHPEESRHNGGENKDRFRLPAAIRGCSFQVDYSILQQTAYIPRKSGDVLLRTAMIV